MRTEYAECGLITSQPIQHQYYGSSVLPPPGIWLPPIQQMVRPYRVRISVHRAPRHGGEERIKSCSLLTGSKMVAGKSRSLNPDDVTGLAPGRRQELLSDKPCSDPFTDLVAVAGEVVLCALAEHRRKTVKKLDKLNLA
jgi:hypothetical protein